ncbi:MAG: DUF885 family protein [Vicinamibacterales bacterium]
MLDVFLDHYYSRRPVNATFTGVHTFDAAMPDWSPDGLEGLRTEMWALRDRVRREAPPDAARFPEGVDLQIADDFLTVQIAELDSRHFVHRNPSLAVGEAVFAIMGLLTRPFAPLSERLDVATVRLSRLPVFLDGARATLAASPLPPEWVAKARREIGGATRFLTAGIDALLTGTTSDPPLAGPVDAAGVRAAADVALRSFADFDAWLLARPADGRDGAPGCGPDLLDVLLRVGHHERRTRGELLASATEAFADAEAELGRRVRTLGESSWEGVQRRLAADHPDTSGYLEEFDRCWRRFHDAAVRADLVTWTAPPIRYVPIPPQTRDAAPSLYYLFYRSPAPFDRTDIYDYLVTPIDVSMPVEEQRRRLEACNRSVIALNHVVHHGGIGHHVQNAHAYRSRSRLGRIAAVDCASRIGMFSGGSLAEGWACYAVDLMEEIGALTPLEAAAQQHTRLRLLARTIVDIGLNQGSLTSETAVQFYRERVGMGPDAARAEVVKNSMFPGTACMYWLGTSAIHELRARCRTRDGAAFSLRRFHDEFLSYGALPVPLIASLMTAGSPSPDAPRGAHAP